MKRIDIIFNSIGSNYSISVSTPETRLTRIYDYGMFLNCLESVITGDFDTLVGTLAENNDIRDLFARVANEGGKIKIYLPDIEELNMEQTDRLMRPFDTLDVCLTVVLDSKSRDSLGNEVYESSIIFGRDEIRKFLDSQLDYVHEMNSFGGRDPHELIISEAKSCVNLATKISVLLKHSARFHQLLLHTIPR